MPDPFKDLEQDITNLLTAAAKNAAANGAEDNGDAEAPRRKRGGQPGNQNARKYSFYSPVLPGERTDAFDHALELCDFSEEVALLRVNLLALLRDPKADPDHVFKTFHVLCRMMEIQRRYRFG